MSYNEDFFKGLGVDVPLDDVNDSQFSEKEKAVAALKEIIEVCAIIRDEAMQNKFSLEESYDFAMAYYTMFLGANLQAAIEQRRGEDGQEEG